MRIAVWNVERALGAVAQRQDAVLRTVGAQILLLTEVSTARSDANADLVVSPAERHGSFGNEAWVSIHGFGVEPVEPRLPYAGMAVAAKLMVDEAQIVVYGSVLPWLAIGHHKPGLLLTGESSSDAFSRVLREQAKDVFELQQRFPAAFVLWAGDFNQRLEGPNYGGRTSSRTELESALSALRMQAWNRLSGHAQPSMCAIDLICGPVDRQPRSISRIDPFDGSSALSDHAGYFIDV